MNKQQSGFTLVEIAIVLVIIGLLLGGVLKGQELITQAKIKNVANDLNGMTAAIYGYQDRYKRLPGDDPGATRWPLIAAPGDGNNVVDDNYASTTSTDESRLFWAELRLAGFIAGATDTLDNATAQPINATGGIVGAQSGGLGLAGLIVCTGSLPAKIAQAIDSQFDDSNATTGNVRALLEDAPPTALTAAAPDENYEDNGTNLYVLCKNI
ncbi:MAG: prepilin-type N-terminal cleavage/methylation domain-containing protein [Propionivibrio sp.]|nr:prepilin-type N-terminal cleavage/methylation domain-containing protein [Propionivibrio sp.]